MPMQGVVTIIRNHGQHFGQVLLTQLATEGLSLIRNLLIARMLGADSLGSFVLAVAALRFVEMASDFGVERFVVQWRREQTGQDEVPAVLLGTVHLYAAIRGIILALTLCALAWPLAHWLAVPDIIDLLLVLALVPFARGFMHHEHRLIQRGLQFHATMWVEVSAASLSAVALLGALYLEGGLLWITASVALQAVWVAIASHMLALRPYQIRIDRAVLGDLVRFGLPLALSGLLLYGTLYGDRWVVAAFVSLADVALFAMIMQCAMLPVQVCGRLMLGLGIPYIAKAREQDADDGTGLTRSLIKMLSVASVMLALTYAVLGGLFGPWLIEWVSSLPALEASLVVVLLVAAAAVRIIRQWLSTVFQAYGDTLSPLKASFWRLASLPAGVLVMVTVPSLASLAMVILCAEMAALIAGLVLMRRHQAKVAASAKHFSPVDERAVI